MMEMFHPKPIHHFDSSRQTRHVPFQSKNQRNTLSVAKMKLTNNRSCILPQSLHKKTHSILHCPAARKPAQHRCHYRFLSEIKFPDGFSLHQKDFYKSNPGNQNKLSKDKSPLIIRKFCPLLYYYTFFY